MAKKRAAAKKTESLGLDAIFPWLEDNDCDVPEHELRGLAAEIGAMILGATEKTSELSQADGVNVSRLFTALQWRLSIGQFEKIIADLAGRRVIHLCKDYLLTGGLDPAQENDEDLRARMTLARASGRTLAHRQSKKQIAEWIGRQEKAS